MNTRMTLDDYQRENFTQAQEEAGTRLAEALEEVAESLGLGDEFTARCADCLDRITVAFLSRGES